MGNILGIAHGNIYVCHSRLRVQVDPKYKGNAMTYQEVKEASIGYILRALGKGEDLDGAVASIIQLVSLWREEENKKNH